MNIFIKKKQQQQQQQNALMDLNKTQIKSVFFC